MGGTGGSPVFGQNSSPPAPRASPPAFLVPDRMVTIAWDVDDVLNDLTRCWLAAWALHRQAPSYGELLANPPHEALGCSRSEYLESLDAFRLSAGFHAMAPVPEVAAWFEGHGDRFRHVAVSAVPRRCAHASAEWTLRHFGRWIRTFHFVPSPRETEVHPVYDAGKTEALKRLGDIRILIDDNMDNVAEAGQAGIRGFLFPRPWNGSVAPAAHVLKALLVEASSISCGQSQ